MGLVNQIQAIIGSILFGGLSSLFWIFLETFISEFKHKWIRLVFEIPFFVGIFYVYELYLIYVIDGILNIFYLGAIILGIFLYFRFYNYHFSLLFNKLKKIIKTKTIKPIHLKLIKIKDILKKKVNKLKKRKKKRHERREKKKSNI